MENKTDFIEREVQKLTLFISNLISKIVGGVDSAVFLESLNNELKGRLDFGFYEILELSDEDLKKKIKGVDVLILEGLLKVFYEIDKKEIETINAEKLKRVSLIILVEIENKTRIFSLERQQIKNYFKSQKK